MSDIFVIHDDDAVTHSIHTTFEEAEAAILNSELWRTTRCNHLYIVKNTMGKKLVYDDSFPLAEFNKSYWPYRVEVKTVYCPVPMTERYYNNRN